MIENEHQRIIDNIIKFTNNELVLDFKSGFNYCEEFIMRESIKNILEDLEKSGKIAKTGYSVKRTKLPRKLKKRNKKNKIFNYTISYTPVVEYLDILVDL